MRTSRPTPITLQTLRDSQRELWRPRCTACGAEPRAAAFHEIELRDRVRELEQRVQELESALATTRG